MAITGNIKTFYLSSLLQLLSNDKKTGILELTDGNDIVQVFFRDGTIINAFGSSRVERLTNYLRSEGIVSAEQLDQCLKISVHTGQKIGKVLVDQGCVSTELIENLLHRQIEQTLFSLFLWDQGEFEYHDQEFDLSDQIVTSFDTMEIVLEASRRVDEISQIKQQVPRDNDVLQVTADAEALGKATLSTGERAVLSLVNGKRTVKRVVIDSGYDELKVYKILFSLVTAGLVIEEKNILKRPPAAGGRAREELKPAAETQQGVPAKAHEAPVQSGEPDREGKASEPGESVLVLESGSDEEAGRAEIESRPSADESFDFGAEPSATTVIKINGRLVSEVDLSDIEPVARGPQLSPVDKHELADALRSCREHEAFEEEDRQYARTLRRKVIIAAACAAGAVVLGALLFFVPFFSETPEKPSVKPATETAAPAKLPKVKSGETVQPSAPAAQTAPVQAGAAVVKPGSEAAAAPAAESAGQEAAYDFFQDQKGWVSINLPPGYTVDETAHTDRTSVVIRYGDDVTISLSIVPDPAVWNAEEGMYAAIVKMQEAGGLKIQKYDTLKHAGCPGYMLQLSGARDQKIVQTTLYRFVCYNKSARVEVSGFTWRTEAGQELSKRICAAIETSFFMYP